MDDMAVTRGLMNSTDSALEFGHEFTVTGDPHRALSQTEAVGTVTSDPQGSTLQTSSPLGVTEQTHHAVTATEQYNPSGQGPEGGENVELEDTC
ncbi:hypothetical protein DPEC_G00286860 [Dallia pectoralis]|uniref:Uncharacterized protein n=1 Tax=Dallia pectoralis TaxID=75939 RepID=A0ACC2FKC8_DALPE|nr:hypothetical protein DPEC_G00286860 [Dallia pectoralis]